MESTSLEEVYASLDDKADTIYVVPLIRYNLKKSDYLYLLYENLINSDTYDIQAISIYQHFRLVIGLLLKKHAILHYHWLEFQDFKSLLGMPWKVLCIWLFKSFGGKIVWTLHNEFPHDQKYLSFHFWLHKKMARWSDKLHVHCAGAINVMQDRLEADRNKFFVFPHPTFPSSDIPRNTAIEKINETYQCGLTTDLPILLMFGNISHYKQMDLVADIVSAVPSPSTLLIAGPIKKGNMNLFKQLSKKSEDNPRIKIIPHFIKEEQVPWFFNAADWCVFNYREILSSGGFELARSYDKKIIAPDKGCLSEAENESRVSLFNSQEELQMLIEQAINAGEHEQT